MNLTTIILIIIALLVLGLIALYNSLVKKRNAVDNAWAQVDVQLQRRLDLIPNVVETVKGYAAHESATLQAVTEARAMCQGARTTEEKDWAQNSLTQALKSLFAVAEQYPDLKANQNFMALQAEISETEDKISYMRQSYNDTVMKYNTAIETFPANLCAGMFGFAKRESFNADIGAEIAPVVDFGQGNSAGQL